MRDMKTNVPLFNDEAWKKANNVLKEVLNGNISDHPDAIYYCQRLDRNGEPMTDKMGLELLDCSRGTNGTEGCHQKIHTTFHSSF